MDAHSFTNDVLTARLLLRDEARYTPERLSKENIRMFWAVLFLGCLLVLCVAMVLA